MSYTELHIGRLKPISGGIEKANQILQENTKLQWCDEESVEKEQTGYIETKKGWKYKYMLYKGKLYEIEESYSGESDGHISHGVKDINGNIDFVLEFYNGGTCQSEMLEELLNKIS